MTIANEDFFFKSKQNLCLSFLHHTAGLLDLEVSQKQQGGCTCVAHQAPPLKQMCRLSNRLNGAFCFCTCVDHFLDDHSDLPFEHGVEQLDNEDEAGAEDEQRQSQEDEAHRQVWQISTGEEVFAYNGGSKR